MWQLLYWQESRQPGVDDCNALLYFMLVWLQCCVAEVQVLQAAAGCDGGKCCSRTALKGTRIIHADKAQVAEACELLQCSQQLGTRGIMDPRPQSRCRYCSLSKRWNWLHCEDQLAGLN